MLKSIQEHNVMRGRSASQKHHPGANVKQVDRWVSGLCGLGLLLGGMRRAGLLGFARTALGGALLLRGLYGHCPLQAAADRSQARGLSMSHPAGPHDTIAAAFRQRPYSVRRPTESAGFDKVQTASEDSFPASDPPSYGPGNNRG